MSLINSTPVVHVGDVGTIFRITVTEKVWDEATSCWLDTPVDISLATTIEILFKRPSGPTRIRPASFTTDGSDGKIEYVTQVDDIDEAGGRAAPWYFAGHVQRPGKKHTTTSMPFIVEAGIPRPPIDLYPLPATATTAAPEVLILVA